LGGPMIQALLLPLLQSSVGGNGRAPPVLARVLPGTLLWGRRECRRCGGAPPAMSTARRIVHSRDSMGQDHGVSEEAKKGALEWDGMYANGSQPFGPTTFAKIDQLLKEHVPEGGTVLELGSGYGRDAIFLAKERKCTITAVEPGEEGTKALSKAASEGGLPITAVCAFAEAFDYAPMKGKFDMVLMDSVLAFCDADVQPTIVKSSLESLTKGGYFVVIGWPKEDDVNWVAKLINEAGTGATVVKDAEVCATKAKLGDEEMEMTWHVTVAQAP